MNNFTWNFKFKCYANFQQFQIEKISNRLRRRGTWNFWNVSDFSYVIYYSSFIIKGVHIDGFSEFLWFSSKIEKFQAKWNNNYRCAWSKITCLDTNSRKHHVFYVSEFKVSFSLEKLSFSVKNCDFGVKNESLFDHLAWNFRSKTGFDQLHFEFRILKILNMNFVLNFWVLSENRPRWWIGRPFRNSSIWKFYGNFENFCQFSEYFAIFPNWIKFWIF